MRAFRMAKAGLLLVVLTPISAPAQDEGDLEVEMFFADEEVVTSAARHEQEIGMSPSAITVITREDIQASGATNFTDLLRQVPGLEVIISTPAYSSVATRVNWTTNNNVFLVLVDGREVNVELLGITNFELLPIHIDDIERIEVIRGPGSALYGANALSGVISIVTRPIPDQASLWAGLDASDVGLVSARARVSSRTGRWGFALSGGGEAASRFSDPRVPGRESARIRALAEYRLAEGERLLIDGSYAAGTGDVVAALSAFAVAMSKASLRLAYETEALRAQMYWMRGIFDLSLESELEFAGIRLARLVPVRCIGNTFDGEVQWTLPRFWSPLLVILGAIGRVSLLSSGQLLDAGTYTDITSSRYHEPGVDHSETRFGTFVHAELTPTDWLTLTGGLRFDFNTVTQEAFSPRLSAVFRPVSGQYLRLGISQSFRKPSYFETGAHMMVAFPEDSPITGPARQGFQEFMTRVIGSGNLQNEELLAFEAGYLGRFLDGTLEVGLDLYYNIYKHEVELFSDIVPDENGLPDMSESSIQYANDPDDLHVVGGELFVEVRPARWLSLLASWTHREITNQASETSPKNLITLGGRFGTDWGLVGSLYIHSRSEFWDRWVPNPAGLLEEFQSAHLDTAILVLGRLGWRWSPVEAATLEAGLKLFLPVSPEEAPYFRFREVGGGVATDGRNYGGDLLRRMITAYLEGAF